MSVIVAVTKGRRTVVAADSLTCFGHHRDEARNVSTIKVQRVGPALICSTGWALYDNILEDFLIRAKRPILRNKHAIFKFFMKFWKALHEQYSFVNDQSDQKDNPFGNLDASFIVANREGIFGVSSDMAVTHFRQYHAVGCGQDYAFGALDILYDVESNPAKIADRAVRAAIRFDIHCGGEVQVFEV